jgi:predicted aconitase
MYHIKGITPEAETGVDEKELNLEPDEKIEIEKEDIEAFYVSSSEPDVIAIGCPHCSSIELKRLYELLRAECEGKGRKIKKDLEFFIFTARAVMQNTQMQRIAERIANYGVKVICDTCFVVSPAFEHYDCVLTNSGKMMRYVPLLCGDAEVKLCKMEDCVREAF